MINPKMKKNFGAFMQSPEKTVRHGIAVPHGRFAGRVIYFCLYSAAAILVKITQASLRAIASLGR